MDPMTIMAAAQAGAGIVQGISGIAQKAKAKKMARSNKRPTYEIPNAITDNQDLIESRAGQGISDATRRELTQGAERGLTGSIDAILAGGGSVNNIADLYSNYTGSLSKMALIDEEMRTKNMQNLIDQNERLAGEQDKAWQVNVYAPYADKAQAAAALTKQGTDNIWKGVNSVLGAGANYATAQQYKPEIAGVYGTGGNLGDRPGAPAPIPLSLPAGPPVSSNSYNWYNPPNPSPSQPRNRSLEISEGMRSQYPGLMGQITPSIFG